MTVQLNTGNSLAVFNLTPMIDCVFLLLIFFLVATELAVEDQEVAKQQADEDRRVATQRAEEARQLKIKLPVASQSMPMVSKPKELWVNIDQQGRFFVGASMVSVRELREIIHQAARTNPLNQAVRIHGDKNSPLQASIHVFDICKDPTIGIRDCSFGTKPPE